MKDEALLRKILQSNHQKVTKPRLAVFRLLHGGPQTIADLAANTNGDVDRVTIYRILDLYERLGVTKRITIGWKYKIELSDVFREHHHHASCLDCGKVMEVRGDGELEAPIKQLGTKSGLVITSHILELHGYCHTCSANHPTSS